MSQKSLHRLFVGDFEFEHQLAGHRGRGLSRTAERARAELAPVWISLASPEDVLWMPEPPPIEYQSELSEAGFGSVSWVSTEPELSELAGRLSLTPWGWTKEIVKWADRLGVNCDPPDFEAVRIANSRRFSFGLEEELGIGLEKSAECRSWKACDRALAGMNRDQSWVFKAEYGMSARERILGRGPQLAPSHVNWIRNRLNLGQPVFLEPWVQAIGEAGIQFDVPLKSSGSPRCVGITPLLTDSAGVYRGSRFDPAAETEFDWSGAIRFGQVAAERAQSLCYHGPLGIDAMWYRDPFGDMRLRSLGDINARWTMGRLSLGFRRLLAPGEFGLWRHIRCPADSPAEASHWWKKLSNSLPQGIRWLRLSPTTLGGRVTRHATGLLFSSDPELLAKISERLS